MNNKRKNRGGTQRPQRPRPVQPEGVYSNGHFMHAATSQVGNIVRIQTASGNVWEGVFRTFSNQFDVVLEVAAKIENPDSSNPTLLADSLVDKLIFKSCDIITMVARDVDPEFATRDTFQTDTAISARLNGTQRLEEKELEPWDASSGINGGDNVSLELEGGANGWDANDMFRKNEQIYGITSTYDHTLAGYTVQLQPSDSADYREAEAKADQIANEIENQPTYKTRQDMENGDEEAMYAAVVRPNQQDGGGGGGGKYVPPAKRKNQNAGKLMRSTPPPAAIAQNNPLPKGATVAPSYNQHGRPHSHTPPHNYNAPPTQQQQQQPPPPSSQQQQQRQAPPPPSNLIANGPKTTQMNGEIKQINRAPLPPSSSSSSTRNVYPTTTPPPPQQQQTNFQEKEATLNHVVRQHREEAVKEFHKFATEFKLVDQKTQQQQQQQQQQQVPHNPSPSSSSSSSEQTAQQQTSPLQQSVSPQENLEKVTNTLKKSTLNPNAKEFVLNPSAKPFTPRSPSTPTASRPHTPQTPSHSPYIPATVGGPVGQPPVPVAMMPMGGYIMPPNQSPFQPPPQGNRVRKNFSPAVPMRTDMASQMQVAAATGQPLLAPAPIPSFVYPPGINSQGYPQMHAVRMYDGPPPPPLQYLPQNPSNTPSPAQPPPYNPAAQGPQPPPQQYQAAPPPQGHQYGLVCPIIPTQPHMMQGMQYLQQPPPPQAPIQVLLPPPPPPQQQQQQQPPPPQAP